MKQQIFINQITKRCISILFIVPLLIFTGCDKGSVNEEPLKPNIPTGEEQADAIYKDTGCRPNNALTVASANLFVDSIKNEKYLYGSRNIDGKEIFWVAKYNNTGETVWEVVNKDNTYHSHAYSPALLKNGNMAIFRTIKPDYNSITIIGCYPVVLNTTNGDAKYINMPEGYCFGYIVPFGDFFFCGLDGHEAWLLGVKQYYTQISNSGTIINTSEQMYIPMGNNNAYWTGNEEYISEKFGQITRGNLYDSSPIWGYQANIPFEKEYQTDISIDNDVVIVKYYLDNSKNEVGVVKLSYTKGTLISEKMPADSRVFAEIGKDYLAPDSLTVRMDKIEISDNGNGTTSYTIFYTLKNNTQNKILNQGTFATYFSYMQKGDSQTGFFNQLYPGESEERYFTFKSLSSNKFVFVLYQNSLYSGPPVNWLEKSFRWKLFKE